MNMRIALNILLLAALGVAWPQVPARAAESPAFNDDKEKASYGLGMYFGSQIKHSGMEVDLNALVSGFKDTLGTNGTRLTEQQAQQAIQAYQLAQRSKLAEKNLKEAEAFLAENKTKPGIKTQTVKLPTGGTAELEYKVLTEGTGPTPTATDTVRVNYRGTFINGKEFDSSAKHGPEPAKFAVNKVVPGWTDALQMMKVGSKWEVYLHPSLAYGSLGSRGIEPNSALVFEMELVGIEPPAAPPQAAPPPASATAPLTSDIIKVPSAEELKKGAKIEVIKAEDAARIAQEQQSKPEKK